MKIILFFAFLITTLSAQNFSDKHLHKLEKQKDWSYQDLTHENPGCLENSICSKENGIKVSKWNDSSNKVSALKSFKKKWGLPIQVLVAKSESETLDPILYNSRCNLHNPKDTNKKIYKGILFLRNDPKSSAIILPKVKNHTTGKEYNVPYGDQPLFIKDNKLYLTSDFESKDFSISITSSGKWVLQKIDPSMLEKSVRLKESLDCKKSFPSDSYFTGSYCTQIWNFSEKKLNMIEQQWSCP
jgi:hypothetical protein